MTLAHRLSSMMRRRGVRSQNALARLSGVSQSSIHRMLHSEGYMPTLPTLQKLARALDTSALWLAHGDAIGTPDPAPPPPDLAQQRLQRLIQTLPPASQQRLWTHLYRVALQTCKQRGLFVRAVNRHRIGRHRSNADLDV